MNEPKYFAVVDTTTPTDFKGIKTDHFSAERRNRHRKICKRLGVPKNAYAFIVDKQHPNGNEVHTIYDNGVIVITNQRTGNLITELIARPAQVARYWGGNVPQSVQPIVDKAAENQALGYNNW